MRSLQRALNRTTRADPGAAPLFSGDRLAEDQASGTIYVLRSKSENPLVSAKVSYTNSPPAVTLGHLDRQAVIQLRISLVHESRFSFRKGQRQPD